MTVSDDELLRRTVSGDADAFAAFFRRYEREVTRFIARRSRLPDDVPDLVADVFFAALRGAGRYRPETETARPWLFGIASRTLASRRRRVARHARAVLRLQWRADLAADEAELVEAAVDAHKEYAELRHKIDGLPSSERGVLGLVALADLSPSEAASALGLSPNAARLRLARARRRLANSNHASAALPNTATETEVSHA